MSTSFAIRTLLKTMPLGQIFTTKQLTGIGSRAAIDQCLHRLANRNVIQRLCNGVFSNGTEKPNITPLELAQIKAGIYNKEVYEHPQTTATRLKYVSKPQADETTTEPRTATHIFATNGAGTTSFNSIFGRIELKATSARKYREDRNEVWEVLKAMWHLGKDGITDKISKTIKMCWGRQSQENLQKYAASIPQWLLDEFPQDRKKAFKSLLQKFSEPPTPNKVNPDDKAPPGSKCSCTDDPDCICPAFTCAYCKIKPIRNRFSLVFG